MTAEAEYDPTASDQFFAAWGRYVIEVMNEGDTVEPEQFALFTRAFRAGFEHGDSE